MISSKVLLLQALAVGLLASCRLERDEPVAVVLLGGEPPPREPVLVDLSPWPPPLPRGPFPPWCHAPASRERWARKLLKP